MGYKSILKYLFLGIITIGAIIICTLFFNTYHQKKEYLESEITPYIFTQNEMFLLEINKLKSISQLKENYFFQHYFIQDSSSHIPLFPLFEKIFSELAVHTSPEKAIVGFYPDRGHRKEIIWYRMDAGEKEILQQLIEKQLSPDFGAMEEKRVGIKIYHYPLPDGSFFSCFFYQGIFCGSFDKELIVRSIQCFSEGGRLNKNSSFVQTTQQKDLSDMNILFKNSLLSNLSGESSENSEEWISQSITCDKNKIGINGYLDKEYNSKGIENFLQEQGKGISFDSSVFTERTILGVRIGITNTHKFIQNHTRNGQVSSIDSLLEEHLYNDINIAYVLSKDSIPQIYRIISMHLKSPSLYLKEMPNLRNEKTLSSLEVFANCALPDLCQPEKNSLTRLVGEYLYIAPSINALDEYISDLNQNNYIQHNAVFGSIFDQLSEKSNITLFGNGEKINRYMGTSNPSDLSNLYTFGDLLKRSAFILELNLDEPSSIYCNSIIYQLP